MTEQQFAYWLQGFAELNPNAPTQEQWQSIREHLATVFSKKTPPVSLPKIDVSKSKEVQDLINRAQEKQGYQPYPPQPYWLDGHGAAPSGPIC